jgi:RNA polymerase sigma-70 factor (ECF subfamily)
MFLDDRPSYQEIGLERFLASVEKKAFRMARIAAGGSTEEALDIVQDAMLAFVRKYAAKPESDWRPLFYRVLQSRIRDWFRREAVRNRWRGWLNGSRNSEEGDDREDGLARVADEKAFEPPRELESREAMLVLEKALQELPVRQQQAFLLRAWEGMSIIETAAAMECSAGSVKSHYARALNSLRQQLEGHWP